MDDAVALRKPVQNVAITVYDAYADRLFQYCWLMLLSREAAESALRAAFAAADAQARQLPWIEPTAPWIYSLAREQCQRQVPADVPDEPVALPGQRDADARLMAWTAVMSLPPAEREALDLATRHEMEPSSVALVLGLTELEAGQLLRRARDRLRQAVGAELLLRRGVHECPACAQVLRDCAGTPTLRSSLHAHAVGCRTCGKYLPHSVSPGRVYALLPAPPSPPSLRIQVIGGFAEQQVRSEPTEPFLRTAPRGRRRRLLATIAVAAIGVGIVAAIAVLTLTGKGTPRLVRSAGLQGTTGASAAPSADADGNQAASADTPGSRVVMRPKTARQARVRHPHARVATPGEHAPGRALPARAGQGPSLIGQPINRQQDTGRADPGRADPDPFPVIPGGPMRTISVPPPDGPASADPPPPPAPPAQPTDEAPPTNSLPGSSNQGSENQGSANQSAGNQSAGNQGSGTSNQPFWWQVIGASLGRRGWQGIPGCRWPACFSGGGGGGGTPWYLRDGLHRGLP